MKITCTSDINEGIGLGIKMPSSDSSNSPEVINTPSTGGSMAQLSLTRIASEVNDCDAIETAKTSNSANRVGGKKKRIRKKKKTNAANTDSFNDEHSNDLDIKITEMDNKSQVERPVDQLIREWKELNELTPQANTELFDSCADSESLIFNALRELNKSQRAEFVFRLSKLGYIVKDVKDHRKAAIRFATRTPKEIRYFLLEDKERKLVEDLVIKTAESLESGNFNQAIHTSGFHPRLQLYFEDCLSQRFDARNFPQDNFEYDYLPAPRDPPPYTAHPPGYFESENQPPHSPVELTENNEVGFLNHSFLIDPLDIPTSQRDSSTSKYLAFPKMAITTQVEVELPSLPAGWTAEKDFKAIGTLTAATQRSIEPVGPHFLAHARRARHKRTFSEDDRIQAQENVKKVEDDDAGEISEPEDPLMLSRDAKDWKAQDHYAVLGLSKYRYKATEEQIKRAHRKKVLRHHPDKKAAAGSTEDDSFFKCIQKATEVLLDPVKRRQFDSIDEHAEVEPPTKKATQKGNFFKLWSPVFKAEGRFSKVQPVPKLGDDNSTKEEVENFYNFWYSFDSWRSFEYLDEDVPDDNENRDQKRHMERKNNNARKKKKQEDNARLRKLVDDASALDERIKRFRTEANAAKNKKKLDREAAEKKAIEDAKAKKEAEAAALKAAEEAAKAEREQSKKAKEAAKNAVKKNKRVLKGSIKDANYFVKGDAPAATIDGLLTDVDLIQGKIDPDEIAALAGKLNGLKVADEIKGVWSDEVKRLVEAGKLKDGEVKNL